MTQGQLNPDLVECVVVMLGSSAGVVPSRAPAAHHSNTNCPCVFVSLSIAETNYDPLRKILSDSEN